MKQKNFVVRNEKNLEMAIALGRFLGSSD